MEYCYNNLDREYEEKDHKVEGTVTPAAKFE